jgi:uncharacterized protein (DUF1015 family)
VQIRPFRALHPVPELAARVACPPYDVLDRDEARRLASGNPMCFLRVSRPDIEEEAAAHAGTPESYARARRVFDAFQSEGWLVRDERPAFYVLRQVQGRHTQTGIAALCSVREYDEGRIRRHEHTRAVPEEDRTRHLRAIEAQPGPVFLAFRDDPAIAEALSAVTSSAPPFLDFTAPDGVRHSVWRAPETERFRDLFRRVEAAYIADGHHRAAAAARVARERAAAGDPGADGFLAVLFPADSLRICPYHRCVSDLGGLSPESFLGEVAKRMEVMESADPVEPAPGEIRLWMKSRSVLLRWPPPSRDDPVAALDVSVLHDRLLAPILGIRDPRNDERLSFVGGLAGAGEVRRRVESGRAALGFVLAPVVLADLMAIADRSLVMPPKSTWFEPKLLTGLLIHVLNGPGAGR